jgi:hypothetical protein
MGRAEFSFNLIKLQKGVPVIITRFLEGEERKGSVDYKDMIGVTTSNKFGSIRVELESDFDN